MTVQLPDFRLEVYLGEWEFKARHHLTASDAETLTIGELLDAGSATSGRRSRRSGSATRRRGARASCARRSPPPTRRSTPSATCSPFAGAEEAMYWALQELVGPGDHAIVTVPNYQSMETVTLRTGAEVSGWELRPENGWAPDLAELEALLRPDDAARRGQLPQQPDRRGPVARDVRARWRGCATSAGSCSSATRSTAAWSSTRRARSRRRATCPRARCR